MRRATRQSTGGALAVQQVAAAYDQLKSGSNRITSEQTAAEIKQYFAAGELQVQAKVVSLLCPVSKARIVDAARGVDCRHLECFDLRSFLQLHTTLNFWECPFQFCRAKTTVDHLRVVEYFTSVARETGEHVKSIELLSDGSYRATEPSTAVDVTTKDEGPCEEECDAKPTVQLRQDEADRAGSMNGDVTIEDEDPSEQECAMKPAIRFEQHDEAEDVASIKGDVYPHQCGDCGKRFKRKRNLLLHRCSHTGEKPYVCDVCGKACSHAGNLKDHMRIHSGEQPYVCDVCGRGFSQGSSLKVHKMRHEAIKPHECDICGKRFTLHTALKVHKLIHGDDRNFVCKTCGKGFKTPQVLHSHMRTHADERRYKCDLCEKTFADTTHLKSHRICHSDERRFSCEVCNKSFKRAAYLPIHMASHGEKSLKCDMCDAAFTHELALRAHKRRHTGEKPYKCCECEKDFRTWNQCNNHRRTHRVEKPSVCDQCGQRFRHNEALKSHMASTHRPEALQM